MDQDGTLYYLHQDHRGTLRKITLANGTEQWSGLCDAWGVPLCETGTNPTIFWYQGQAWYKLDVNGQTYCVSPTRLYDPEDGRFVERDPVPRSRVRKGYSFAKGQPARRIDPTGRKCCLGPDGKEYKSGEKILILRSLTSGVRPGATYPNPGTVAALEWYIEKLQEILAVAGSALSTFVLPLPGHILLKTFLLRLIIGVAFMDKLVPKPTIDKYIMNLRASAYVWTVEEEWECKTSRSEDPTWKTIQSSRKGTWEFCETEQYKKQKDWMYGDALDSIFKLAKHDAPRAFAIMEKCENARWSCDVVGPAHGEGE